MPYLKDIKYDKQSDHRLLSGRYFNNAVFFEKTIRSDRDPKDTPSWLHRKLDKMFNKKFGIKARSNSLFCTGSAGQAQGYGDIFVIFPKGPYKIIWSDEVPDLFIDIKSLYIQALDIHDRDSFDFSEDLKDMVDLNHYSVNDYIEERVTEDWEKYYGEDTKGGVWTYTFDDYDLKELEKLKIKKGYKRDIFIKGFSKEKVKDILHDRYGGLYPKNLIWSPDISLEEFIDKNNDKYEKEYIANKVSEAQKSIDEGITDLINTYSDDDIIKAIKSRNEIMLSSNGGYYAVSVDRDVIDPIFSYFKEFGYHYPEDIKIKIGQEKWESFKDLQKFDSVL